MNSLWDELPDIRRRSDPSGPDHGERHDVRKCQRDRVTLLTLLDTLLDRQTGSDTQRVIPSVRGTEDTSLLPLTGPHLVVRVLPCFRLNRFADTFSIWEPDRKDWRRTRNRRRIAYSTPDSAALQLV